MSKFPTTIPKTPRELEVFYLRTQEKLGGTDTTLSDEEKKSLVPMIGMLNDLARRVLSLEKSSKRNIAPVTKRNDTRMLQAKITSLEERIKDIERQL